MNLTPAMLAHNNTHSVSRILRNIKLIREHMQDAASIKTDVIELRLQKIEEACNECKEQVDQFYLITKTMTEEDAKAYIAQYNNEEELRKEGAVEFAKWLLEQEISYVDNTVYGDVYKYKGVIVGIPELYEIYKQETY